MSLALLACAPATPPQPAGDADRLAIARLEARREAGTAELLARADGPATPATLLAIRALGRVGDPPAIAALLAHLRAPDPQRRGAAIAALGHAALLGADVSAAEPALITAWNSATPPERRALVTALGRLGTAAALPILTDALAPTSPPDLRETAAIALGVLGRRRVALDPPARAALLALAADPRFAYPAAYALAHEHAPTDRPAADAALVRLTRASDPETRMTAVAGLARRKTPAADTFTAALRDPDWRVRVAAVRGLAAEDPAALRPVLDEPFVVTVPATGPSRPWPRAPGDVHPVLEALSLLTSRPGPSPVDIDRNLLEPAAVASPRIACALASLAARAPDWRPPLRCADAADPAARHEQMSFETGLLGHGFGGAPDVRLARLAELAADPDPRIRSAAVAAIAAVWPEAPAAVEGLLGHALVDSSPAVAGAAAEAVAARFAEPRPAPFPALWRPLVDRAGTERDGELFAALAAAIAAIDDPTGLVACRPALPDPNPVVRAAARGCVTALADVDPGPSPSAPPSLPPHAPASLRPHLWRLLTTRGEIVIELDPLAAPWHVAALAALTRQGFYDGLTFHRVVPGFVVQGGDPHGTGWGGPGFRLPSEPGDARFDRGAVGIADAGKDTGGSQFFIMHARAPHLEGRYTHVGRVRAGLDVVDRLIVGDAILSATLRE